MEHMEFDLAVIGSGPAGLTSAIYATRYGLKTVVFEDPTTMSQLALAPFIENYPGFKGSGLDLLMKMKEQAIELGADHRVERVLDVERRGEIFTIKTDENEYISKAVIIATGGKHKELGVRGEKEFLGRGVSYCAICDGFFFRGKRVLVVGGGNTALVEAMYLKDIGCDVTVIHRRDEFRADRALQDKFFRMNIRVIWNSVVERIEGRDRVERVVIRNLKRDELEVLNVEGVFIAIGMRPQVDLALKLGVELDENGYIKVDKLQRTNVEGVFAAGDCCGNPLKQVITACSDGAVAAYSAYKYITSKKMG